METLGITEAAQRLGVSERTIYRLLQAGKLKRSDMSDKNVRHVRLIMDERLSSNLKNDSEIEPNLSDVSDRMSDTVRQSGLDSLRAEMAIKDEQIARLIEAQREMTATLQKLQEQMFELARLVLSQNAASGASSVAQSAATRPTEPGATQSRLWGFLRRTDNK